MTQLDCGRSQRRPRPAPNAPTSGGKGRSPHPLSPSPPRNPDADTSFPSRPRCLRSPKTTLGTLQVLRALRTRQRHTARSKGLLPPPGAVLLAGLSTALPHIKHGMHYGTPRASMDSRSIFDLTAAHPPTPMLTGRATSGYRAAALGSGPRAFPGSSWSVVAVGCASVKWCRSWLASTASIFDRPLARHRCQQPSHQTVDVVVVVAAGGCLSVEGRCADKSCAQVGVAPRPVCARSVTAASRPSSVHWRSVRAQRP